MDQRLRQRLERLEKQIDILKEAETAFFALEAHSKVLAAQLFLKADGKNVAEKEAQVYASQDWIDFSRGLAEAQSKYNHERRRYELRIKAYDAEHLTMKVEAPVIKRG